MKKILLLAIFAIVGSTLTFASTSYALDEALLKPLTGAVNPGSDPNENMGRSGLTEAEVASVGNCKECLARLKHGRMNDNTPYRPGGSGSDTGTSKPTGATK
ncbi:MAG: hypothetical protein J7501_07160 [Bdellovibrio sp.]|nr:hypothetical protein [Bdellovibrio sp.]